MPTRRRTITLLLSLAILLVKAPPLFAVDGVVEISQAGILAGGGFPYRITAAGSYRLTSNLTVPTDVSAIVVSRVFPGTVTIDLNGFTMQGTRGPGTGILSEVSQLIVRNGTLLYFGDNGIQQTGRLIAEDLMVLTNHGHGIVATGKGLIRNVIAHDNTLNGVQIAEGLITGCVLTGNARESFVFTRGALYGGYSNNVLDGTTRPTSGVNLGGNLCQSVVCP